MKMTTKRRPTKDDSEVTSFYFDNGDVENQVTLFFHHPTDERLVFVPNWKAKKYHWIKFVSALNDQYNVEYFESREKKATKYKSEELNFTFEKISHDLVSFLNTSVEPYHLVGASIGACAIIKGWDKLKVKPKTLTLLCPFIHPSTPLYFQLFRYIPKHLLSTYAKAVYPLLAKSKRMKPVSNALYKSLNENNASKLKIIRSSVRDILKMRITLEEYQKIDCPCMIVFAEHDHIHTPKDAKEIAAIIPAAHQTGFASFRAVNDVPCAHAIMDWLK